MVDAWLWSVARAGAAHEREEPNTELVNKVQSRSDVPSLDTTQVQVKKKVGSAPLTMLTPLKIGF